MIVGMDVMTKFSRLKNVPIEQAPFLYMPKDVLLRRLLMEWTTLDAVQIQETVGSSFQEQTDLDSDSDGGASTVPGISSKAFSPMRKQATLRSFTNDEGRCGRRRRRRRPTPSPLVERCLGKPPWSGCKADSNAPRETSFERYDYHLNSRINPHSAPFQDEPSMRQGQQPVAQSRRSRNRPDTRQKHEVLPTMPTTLHLQTPETVYPKPEEWINLAETTRKAADERHDSSTHNNAGKASVSSICGRQQASHNTGTGTDHPPEIYRSKAEYDMRMLRGRSPDSCNSRRRAASRGTSSLERYADPPIVEELRRLLNGKAASRSHDEMDPMRDRMDNEHEMRKQAGGMSSKDTTPQEMDDLGSSRADMKAQLHEEASIDFHGLRDSHETHNQTFARRYRDLERFETEQQHLNEETVQKNFKQEEGDINKREKEQQHLRGLGKMAEMEADRVEAEPRDGQHQDLMDDLIYQLRNLPQDDVDGDNETLLTQDPIHRYRNPHVEYDTVSYFTEETETTGGSSAIDGADRDDQATPEDGGTLRANIEVNDQDQAEVHVNSDVERSQPWKGPAHLGSFVELTPLYLRGSDAGQTWYHGPKPIYIIEFEAGYDGEFATYGGTPDRRPYLLVSQLWVDPEALDRFGLKYVEVSPSQFFLDPTLPWKALKALVKFTCALREVETFKKHGQGYMNRGGLVGRSPPPPTFFRSGGTHAFLDPSLMASHTR